MREHVGDRPLERLHKSVPDRLLHKNIVRREAGLPGIQNLAVDDALRARGHVRPPPDDDGALAAQFQRRRRQVPRARRRHELPDARRARKHEMVEGQRRERRGRFGPAEHDARDRLVVGAVDQPRDQERRPRRELRRLEEHGVARRERRRDGRQEQHDGVVPGRDDADDALGLVLDGVRRAHDVEREVDAPPLRPAPAPDAGPRGLEGLERHEHVGEARDLARPHAEVRRHGGNKIILVREQELDHDVEAALALPDARRAALPQGCLLDF
mmetsp:Transcript_2967/g.8576  ORF Transcript_2967/g.8576 Transcript_2967/m.8576 type:complete len:270 (-) Transcript_2967:53-862(-)